MKSIYITGVPGTGKSTIGKILGLKLNIPLLEISKFVLEEQIFEKYDEERQTHIFDEDIVLKRLEELLKEGIKYMIIGPILPIDKKFIQKVIVLFTEPKILRERLVSRNYGEKKINENIDALLMGITLGEARNFFPNSIIIEHNTTIKTIEESVTDILKDL